MNKNFLRNFLMSDSFTPSCQILACLKNCFIIWLGIALLAGCLLGGWFSPSQAFLSPSRESRGRVFKKGILPTSPPFTVTSTIPEQKRLKRFKETYEGDWIGLWNPWGTLHRLYLKNSSQARGLSRMKLDDQGQIAEQARRYIQEFSEFFKITPEELVLRDTICRGGIVYCRFDQFYKEVPVYGGGAQFRFDLTGNLLLIGSDTYPEITLNTFPVFTREEAVEIARKKLNKLGEKCVIGEVKLYVFPLLYEEGLEYSLVWQVPLFMDLTRGSSVIFIDAHTGEIILTYKLERMAEKKGMHGRVGGLILPKYFDDIPQWVPFANQKVYLLNDSVPIGKYDLKEDPGWAREGMWEYGVPIPQDINSYGHAGCPDPAKGVTGQKIFGYNLKGDYTNLMRPKYLTTGTFDCRNRTGITLSFWRWLGVQREYWESDSGERTDYDRATVEVSTDGGRTWTVIWSNGTSQIEDGVYDSFMGDWKGWQLQFFDISSLAEGKDLVIRWGMGATDGSGTFCGWNIDDIGIYESLKEVTDPNGQFFFPDTNDVPINNLLVQLKGTYIEVFNEDGSSAINTINGIEGGHEDHIQADWDTSLSSLNDFDEFNAFYHTNLLLDYIKAIDPFYDAMDKKPPVKVIVRYGDNYKNAFWSPENKICFGEGDSCTDGYRNFAHFSDIIYHEYTHAITDSFYSFLMPPLTSIRKTTDGEQTGPVFVTEFDAMHEAYSDYWAATINNDPLIGDGDFWIRHKYVRNLDNKFKYPDDYGDDAYANSLILSGAMWEVRGLLGKEVADTLFHFARYGGATTFDDFLVDILLQDEMSFDGEHASLLKDVFGFRGISRSPSAPSGVVAVAGDTYVDLEWNQNPESEEVFGYYVYFRTENDIASDREDPSVRRDAKLTNTYRLEGLTNGTTYVLKVTAYNVYNAESEDSELAYATPYTDSMNASLGSEKKILCFLRALQ